MIMQRTHISLLFVFLVFVNGCASRLPLKNASGQPISKEALKAKKNNGNFYLYALGGGALSFGASFFLGSMINRASDPGDNSTLWLATGAGTAIGLAYFAHAGMVRDHNLAVMALQTENAKGIDQELVQEQEKRKQLEDEKQKLLMEREKQEAERKAILEKLKKKKDNNNEF